MSSVATAGQSSLIDVKIAEMYAPLLLESWRYKAFYGGRGAARSWSFARALLIKAAEAPYRILCTREHQSSIKDSVHKLLRDQIEVMGLPGFNVTDKLITHVSGSEFLFKGLRYNIEDIKSTEGIDLCWVEQAERTSNDSWKVLTPTIRKDGSEIWMSFNVNAEDDPTYKRFGPVHPPNCYSLKTSWRDNPWFPAVLREEMEYDREVDPDAYAHVWEGEPKGSSEAQVLHGKWVIEAFETGGEGWDGPYYGADWGFSRSPTTLVRVWIRGSKLYLEHEAYAVGCEISPVRHGERSDTAKLFDAVPGAGENAIRADSSRPETIRAMQREGFKISGAMKWPGSVEDGVTFLRSFVKIVIHDRCRYAAQEARLYSHKVDSLTGDVRPEIVDQHNHIWDAVRYALAPLIRQRPTWGVA